MALFVKQVGKLRFVTEIEGQYSPQPIRAFIFMSLTAKLRCICDCVFRLDYKLIHLFHWCQSASRRTEMISQAAVT